GRSEAWARKALADELEKLLDATPGDRNNQLFRSAAALAEIVSGGGLSEWEVKTALENAARNMGLDRDPNCGPGQIKATIDSGFAHGMQHPRGPKASTNGRHTYQNGYDGAVPHPADDPTQEAQGEAEKPQDETEAGESTELPHII